MNNTPRDGDMLLDFMARREDWSEGVSLYARQRIVGVSSAIAQPLVFVKREPGLQLRAEPIVTLQIHEAQRLMDELWQCGLRPTEGTGSGAHRGAGEGRVVREAARGPDVGADQRSMAASAQH